MGPNPHFTKSLRRSRFTGKSVWGLCQLFGPFYLRRGCQGGCVSTGLESVFIVQDYVCLGPRGRRRDRGSQSGPLAHGFHVKGTMWVPAPDGGPGRRDAGGPLTDDSPSGPVWSPVPAPGTVPGRGLSRGEVLGADTTFEGTTAGPTVTWGTLPTPSVAPEGRSGDGEERYRPTTRRTVLGCPGTGPGT